MHDFFKNIADKNSCSFQGVCSVHPTVSALYQVLIAQVKEIAFYLVKLKEFGILNNSILFLCIDALSIFLINTSFSDKKYLEFFKKLYKARDEIKNKYIEHCSKKEFPCEIINTVNEPLNDFSVSNLIKYAQDNLLNKKAYDEEKKNLFELISIFARLTAINIVKIRKTEGNYENCVDDCFETIRFFALVNGNSIRNEKLIRRIKEFSKASRRIKERLYSVYEKYYGKKESASVLSGILDGHSILVSGDDLDELAELLKVIENFQADINVYTNGPLFLAHLYPYFKNNKYLKGHFGKDNAEYDFSLFEGTVLITQNFVQKIDNLYKGEIYSNKLISFSKVFEIKKGDYLPLVKSALKIQNSKANIDKTQIKVLYNSDKIFEKIDDFKGDKINVFAGEFYKTTDESENIKIDFPAENDILLNVIKKLNEKNVEIELFFSQCNLKSLEGILLFLDYKNIQLNIGKCSDFLINPHVIEALKTNFNVKFILQSDI